MATNERGYGLLEVIVSLPVLTLLLGTTVWLASWLWSVYRQQSAALELRQEVGSVMERITDEAQRGRRFAVGGYGDRRRLTIYGLRDEIRDERLSVSEVGHTYEVTSGGKLVMDRNSWPMTGDSAVSPVRISRFFCEGEGAILYLEIEGTNGKENYRLATEIYFPAMADGG